MGLFGESKQDIIRKYENLLKEKETQIEKMATEIIYLRDGGLKSKSQIESESKEDFVLTHGEYIIGEDIKPGRYSFKVIQGTDGMVETTGRDWEIIGIGNYVNQVMAYQNLSLKVNTKLKIRGDIKLRFTKEKPINIEEDIKIIEVKNREIENLKSQLKELREKYEKLKLQFNQPLFEDEYILKYGYYYGGENITPGIYDLKVVSGIGYVKERGNFHRMGNVQYGNMELFGLKVSNKTKIEVTDDLVISAIRKNIKIS